MSIVAPYQNRGPLAISSHLDLQNIAGKSVVVTGGSNGLGKAYVEAFSAAGAFVTFGDVDTKAGIALEASHPNTKFIHCDVTSWESQVLLFEGAEAAAPSKTIDVVIANAGIIAATDPVLEAGSDSTKAPQKPTLDIISVNVYGVLYSSYLALYYFQRGDAARDRVLILKCSLAGYLDLPNSPCYVMSKFAVRGLMRTLRKSAPALGVRVCSVAPWLINTMIMTPELVDMVRSNGVEFALAEDSAKAMLRIASDPSANGRCLAIVPRSVAPEGYYDLDDDDSIKGDNLKGLYFALISIGQGETE